MDKQVASALIDIAVRELRLRSYADLSAMIGDPQCKEVRGSDGKQYQIEIETLWDVPENKVGMFGSFFRSMTGPSHQLSIP